MTTPILGAAELVLGQAIPETTVNDIVLRLEQGAQQFSVLDKDLTVPPGSPASGAAWIVGPAATGAWAGKDEQIAFWQAGTGWRFIVPIQGMRADVADEDTEYRYDGADWVSAGVAGVLLAANNLADLISPAAARTNLGVYSEAETDDAISAAVSGIAPVVGSIDAQYFGDGSDGDVTISSGTTTLTRDMYYNDLTIDGTGSINPGSFRIFVNGVLDISAAPVGAIALNGINGTNSTAAVPGAAGGATASNGTLAGNAGPGSNGAAGGTGNGAQSASAGGLNGIGGVGGTGGKGGDVGATVGGAARAATTTTPRDLRRLTAELALFVASTFTRINGGFSAPGGSSGAGDGTGSGGGGGGGGSGGAIVFVAARTIARGTNTTAGIIQARGGTGGNGGLGTGGTNRGGGGGGAGGSGGWIYLIYRTLTGSVIANALDASGGGGGAGANGTGTGGGGDGGGSGAGGRIDVYDLAAGTQAILNHGAPVAGNPASGGTGGAALAAAAHRAAL